ncbi:cation-transporting P-type ATPase [Periweissella cryptocerci]|uniref:Cation-transporting P-type ATPase n=1 Tax=Periweissella cryptocerci TaxID=2506420 RepID=A0A4P6YX26_9LACO|nr:cation-transporting P-type ATPase [Periweissella cryptocerci]QBO37356.1 cation-transporting P-type ATPase [Periweissella cryptocerci]
MEYYSKSTTATLNEFKVDEKIGLTAAQVVAANDTYGANTLTTKAEIPYWKMYLLSFKEPLIIVLVGAVILSFVSALYDLNVAHDTAHGMASIYEGVAILFLVIVNATLSFWQEVSARKGLNSLKQIATRQTATLRDRVWSYLDATALVPGDIIKVELGDFIEADVRWLQTSELEVIESHLTGESDAIQKQIDTLDKDIPIGDRTNMGYSGSTVTNGSAQGIVVATGQATELGKIAELIQNVADKTSPLQKSIDKLAKVLMFVAAGLVTLTIIVSFVRGYNISGTITITDVVNMLSTAIVLAVAAIPDALPVVLSIVLTIGASRLVVNKGLIKSLKSVETLGATSFVTSDKTGTLTKNEMTVVKFFANGTTFDVTGRGYESTGAVMPQTESANGYDEFIKGALLNNEASVSRDETGMRVPYGNPTEVALVVLGEKIGQTREAILDSSTEIVRVLPFDSTRKMMSVIVKYRDEYTLYTKGAPDIIIQNAKSAVIADKDIAITAAQAILQAKITEFAEGALRTLAIAQRKITAAEALGGSVNDLEEHLVVTGIVGIIDPPREEVRDSVKTLHDAHINVVMITGDHEATARAIAYDLQIVDNKQAPVIQGVQIEAMTDEELFIVVPDVRVYARVSPEHKQRIIEQLQRHGEIVAMTGDGVNDAPALKAADIGIAMGITGTEVTKDAADLILLDDKFTTIEKAIESGRMIYANIKNFIRHELITNVAEVLSLLIGLLFITTTINKVEVGTPTLTALMVLWVNMVSDSLPSFAIGYDTAQANLMSERPRNPKESILANGTWSRVLIRGTIMGLMVFLAFLWAAHMGMPAEKAQTVAFLTLVFGQLWHVFDARSSSTLYHRNPFDNKRLVLAVLFAGSSSIAVTLLPFFNTVMGTAPLSFPLYLAVLFVPAIPTFVLSGIKELFGVKFF